MNWYSYITVLVVVSTVALAAAGDESSEPLVLAGHKGQVNAAAWLDNDRVATAGFDKTIRVWDASSTKQLHVIDGHAGSIFTLAVSPDGKWLASAGEKGLIKLWNLQTLESAGELAGHRGSVYHLDFSPDGTLLASCGEDDTRIFVWNVAEAKSVKQLTAEDPDDKNRRRSMHCVQFSPDGKQLISTGEDRTVRLWDIDAGKEVRRFEGAEYSIFTENGKKIERTTKKAGSELALYTLAFGADGKRIAAGGLDKTIRIWETSSGKLLQTFTGHEGFVYDLFFKGSADTLVSCGHTGHVSIWNLQSGEARPAARSPTLVYCSACSPDGKKIVLVSRDCSYVIGLSEERQ